ncbi:MBL fold metallo-hydrolase [Mangrovimonas aestuarii]|uniref:MBL fold metallo-hydrolase n=1 Tax=Mangrovimonas aestuarii TaxID=3018443 RepID=UPI002378C951|nr:MBL fold metallo-hydrolase [Mangrovimonas aestuarii]
MRRLLSFIIISSIICFSCKQNKNSLGKLEDKSTNNYVIAQDSDLKIFPINHATMVLEKGDDVIYIDPVGGTEAFSGQKRPTLVLITDIHGDHYDLETLKALSLENIPIMVPQAVADLIPSNFSENIIVMNNDDIKKIHDKFEITAIPMYNLREEALKFHSKGRGNGYLIHLKGQNIYISGDTEDIPEMRRLKDVDIAFVCMNLPYTMTVNSAADAVLEFKPKVVYPYHYRGADGLSDVNTFRDIVNNNNKDIKVFLLDWYSKK